MVGIPKKGVIFRAGGGLNNIKDLASERTGRNPLGGGSEILTTQGTTNYLRNLI